MELIEQLCEDLTPVKPVRSPEFRALFWLLFCYGITLCYMFFVTGTRDGAIEQLLTSKRFLLENVLGLFSGLLAAYVAFDSMLPGNKHMYYYFKASLLLLISFLMLTSYGFYDPPIATGWDGWRFGCEREILLVSLIPMFVFFIVGRNSLPLEKAWTGFLIGVASSIPASVMMQLSCMYAPWHTLLFHQLPVILIAAAASYVATRRFKNI